MAEAKKSKKLDEKILKYKKQLKEIENLFYRLQGRIDELEDQKKEDDEKAN